MGVAPPPSVSSGVIDRVRSRTCAGSAPRAGPAAGERPSASRRTREFERKPLPLLLRLYDTYGPVFSIRLIYAPVVFALGPAANHYITVSPPRTSAGATAGWAT